MVDVNLLSHSQQNFSDGSMVKRIVHLNNEKYIFKANNGFPYDETPTHFGEVFYSKIGELLDCSVVKAKYAKLNIEGKASVGCLIKHYVTDDIEEALTFGQIVRILSNKYRSVKEDMNVQNILCVVGPFAHSVGLKFDYDQVELQLSKMVILDYFFSQRDRHYDNVEFLRDRKEIKLAPIFDNGLCFNLGMDKNFFRYISKFGDKFDDGCVQFMTLERIDVNTVAAASELLANQIVSKMRQDARIDMFVKSLMKLNVKKVLYDTFSKIENDFPKDYVENCLDIYKKRCNILQNQLNISARSSRQDRDLAR